MIPEQIEFPIVLQNVTRRFGGVAVVDDLSLRIARGTTFGFIGINGAGKTTALRMLVGLLPSHAGQIMLAGLPIPHERDRARSRIGYVPDRPNIYGWMRVEQAIEFTRSFYPNWNMSRCQELLEMFELDPRKRARHLSKGQGAKLSLLLAISHDPDVLILDEPTSGFDPVAREEMLEGVLAVRSRREQTVLFSSHTLADVQRLADSVGILHQGKLLVNSSVDSLLDSTKRVLAVLEDESVPCEAPPGVVFQQVRGREWMMTVRGFKAEQMEFILRHNRVSHVEVQDVSLDELFKDFVRGKKETVC